MKLAKKNIESLNDYSEDEKQIIGKIYGYETFLAEINKQNKIKEKADSEKRELSFSDKHKIKDLEDDLKRFVRENNLDIKNL